MASVDVHHIKPVESAHSLQEMEALCYDPGNLMALCIPCHVKVHKEMGKSTRQNHKDRSSQSLARWIEKHTKSTMEMDKDELADIIKDAADDGWNFLNEAAECIKQSNKLGIIPDGKWPVSQWSDATKADEEAGEANPPPPNFFDG